MTLVDTSAWINHFRSANPNLLQLLGKQLVGVHPDILGEIACGNIKDRQSTLGELRALPRVVVADEADVYYLLEKYRLWGTGVGWVDLNVLASAAVAGWGLLTADVPLQKAAAKVGVPLA